VCTGRWLPKFRRVAWPSSSEPKSPRKVFVNCSAVNIMALQPSETPVLVCQSTRGNIPDDLESRTKCLLDIFYLVNVDECLHNKKVKFTQEQVMKAHRSSGDIALHVL
jgi:hypothetical protein